MRQFTKTIGILVAAAAATGCMDYGPEGPHNDYDPYEYPGLEELGQPLTQLATPCTFGAVGGVNTMTIVVATGETAVISKRSSDSAMLVNGVQCGTATSSQTKVIDITGSAGNDTVILDFVNGTFAPGYGATSPGIVVDLVAGASDTLKVRGSTSTDNLVIGADGIAFNNDNYRDVAPSNVDSYTVSMGSGNDSFSGSGGKGTGAAYASALVVYGGPGNDTMYGGTAADTLSGGPGNDTLSGAEDAAADVAADTLNGDEGDDTFACGNASNGGDTFNGGDDTDTVSYADRTNPVTVTMGAGADDGEAAEADTVAADIEVVVGGDGDDSLTGSANGDELDGGPGADTIVGGDGDDTLKGGDGDDTLTAGADADGADVFIGGDGTDVVTYAARGVGEDLTITVGSGADDGETGEADDVQITVENVIGGAGDDSITGSSKANTITGGDGDDTVDGGAGDDTFLEGAADSGSDTFIGGAGTDTVDYSSRVAALTVTIDGTADDGLAGEADDVQDTVENVLCGTGDDTITGSAEDNLIEGGAGADTLSGGDGMDELYGEADDDVIDGGAGDDTLDGGAGDDDLDCGAGQGDIGFVDAADTTSPAANCEL